MAGVSKDYGGYGFDDGSDGNFNCEKSVPQSVIVSNRGGNLVHRYINREIGVCLYLHTWNVTIEPKFRDLAIVFQQASLENVHLSHVDSRRKTQFRADVRGPRSDYVKLPMAINSGPLVEDAKRAVEIPHDIFQSERRNLVRLYRFNKGATFVREWRDFPGGLIEMLPGDTNGKLQYLLIGGRVLSRLHNGRRKYAAVKSSHELIEHLAEHERELGRDALVNWTDENAPCPIGIHMDAGSIRVFLDKTFPQLSEGYAVRVCPFDALPAPIEW